MSASIRVAGEVQLIEATLAASGTPKRADGAKAYLKSDLDFHGVDAKGIRATVREIFDRNPEIGHDETVSLVRALWQRPNFEMRAVGVGLMERYRSRAASSKQ